MESICLPVGIVLALLTLVGALIVGVVVLLKLGVITKYALKEEPPDTGDYDLDQSHEAGQ